jgi:hypothetical protein
MHLEVGHSPEMGAEQGGERLQHGLKTLVLPLEMMRLQEKALVPEERSLDGHGLPLMS